MKNKKVLSILMLSSIMTNTLIPVLAESNTITNDGSSSTTITKEISSSYSVLIPQSVSLSGDSVNFSIQAKGNIEPDKELSVTTTNEVLMTRANDTTYSGKATISLEGTIWDSTTLTNEYDTKTGIINFNEVKSGNYSGTLDFSIKLDKKTSLINYNLDGGTLPDGYVTKFAVDESVILSTPTKEGYTFNGWFTELNYTNQITEIKKGTLTDVNIYAKWTENNAEVPVINTVQYMVQSDGGGAMMKIVGSLGVEATVNDGGTLSYDWDLYKYQPIAETYLPRGIAPLKYIGKVKIVNIPTTTNILTDTIMNNMISISTDEWGRDSQDYNKYKTTYSGIAGYITITNTKNGKISSTKVWVGDENYKEVYENAKTATYTSDYLTYQ